VKSKLEITKGYLVRHRRIVLVDDVFTSGSTLLAMRDLILPYQPQVVKGLVIAKNQKNSFWK
jgi:adenine/guanine phosphoribosyltransferase-like PRPP-binding protein